MPIVKMRAFAGILALLIFLFLAASCVGTSGRKMVVVFKGGQTEVPFEENNGQVIIKKPLAFRVPAFVGGMVNNKEFLAVFCDARYQGFSDWSFIEAAVRTSYEDHNKWSDAKIFTKNTRKNATNSVAGEVTAVMKGNKIFVFVPNWDVSTRSWVHHPPNTEWDVFMNVGSVVNCTDPKSGGVCIKWEKRESLKSLLPKSVNRAKGSQFIGGVGNGVVMKNGAIVFPIQIANIHKQVSASIMYSTDDGNTWIIGGTTPNGPSECSVVEWGEDKLLLTTRFDSGHRIVYESDNMGQTWKQSLMFSGVWGNQPNRRDVGNQGTAITAPVDGKDVLLFSHPLNKKGRYSRDTLQLWMSDGQRIVCVGTISEKGKGESSGYSILAHVGDNLYSIHEINPYGDWKKYNAPLKEWDRVIALSPLPHFYESVKNTVRAWRRLDMWLEIKGIPADGLVGFLGNSKTDGAVWADWYNSVDATVTGGKRVDGGFRFEEQQSSGARWPVVSQGQNQFYIFTKWQFTLTATVIIHSINVEKYISIFGASGNSQGSSVMLGLGYTKEKKWVALHTYNSKISTEISFALEEEHHVAITFKNGAASVYVDGVDITKGKLKLYNSAWITHFFMGGLGKPSKVKGGSCTVKNVMLFNRDLDQEEIVELSELRKDIPLDEPTETTDMLRNAFNNRKSLSKTKSRKEFVNLQQMVPDHNENNKQSNKYPDTLRDIDIEKDVEKGNGGNLLFFSLLGCLLFSILLY